MKGREGGRRKGWGRGKEREERKKERKKEGREDRREDRRKDEKKERQKYACVCRCCAATTPLPRCTHSPSQAGLSHLPCCLSPLRHTSCLFPSLSLPTNSFPRPNRTSKTFHPSSPVPLFLSPIPTLRSFAPTLFTTGSEECVVCLCVWRLTD